MKVEDKNGIKWNYNEVEWHVGAYGFYAEPKPSAKILRALRGLHKTNRDASKKTYKASIPPKGRP